MKNLVVVIMVIIVLFVINNKMNSKQKICSDGIGCFEKIEGFYNFEDAKTQCKNKGMTLLDRERGLRLNKDKETLAKLNNKLNKQYEKETKDNPKYRNIEHKYAFFWLADDTYTDTGIVYQIYEERMLMSVTSKQDKLSVICVDKQPF